MYENLSNEDKDTLTDELYFKNIEKIKEYMEYISEIQPRGYESDTYYIINSNSLDEVLKKLTIIMKMLLGLIYILWQIL